MKKHLWKDQGSCLGLSTNFFFDKYEEDILTRNKVDMLCGLCPVAKKCFAVGISGKEWGVWGGVYLEDGEISREFNSHKTKKDWSDIWQSLTMDKHNE